MSSPHAIRFWPFSYSSKYRLGQRGISSYSLRVTKKGEKKTDLLVVPVLYRVLLECLIGYALQIIHERLSGDRNV
jgi:hypothetical protein